MSILVVFFLLLGCPDEPTPYKQSEVIKNITFDPVSNIIIKAEGSDNWPITWADDDNLYTSWGDGKGFRPYTDKKYSLGVSRIEGEFDNFRGINVASPSSSTSGGNKGPKASGMLMVDSKLYMWVRNTNNSTLAWSDDFSKSWNWGFKFINSFGCPTFLNFGKNYEGSRDDYVYIYSQDGPSAYESYDGIVLARVHRTKIKDKDSYRFFKGMDKKGKPIWTVDINQRMPIFKYDDHCLRLEVVYNSGIQRYLMTVAYDFEGGWGIFDAPEPWGPWTTVFHTEKWDVEGTHGYRFPTKWIFNNGKTMYLVFSGLAAEGYDAFNVRRMDIVLNNRK